MVRLPSPCWKGTSMLIGQQTTNSRNRDSVADLEEELYDIFTSHHESRANANGEPAIPASTLVDVIRIFGELHDGMQLLSEDEESKLAELVSANPGLEVTPTILLGFLSALTAHSPKGSPDTDAIDLQASGSGGEDDSANNNGRSSRSSSRGPPPQTPSSGRFPESPFDSGRRQRTAPLQHAVPSSWNSKRAVQSGRRRSDAGSYGRATSDSESATPSRSSSRARARSRAPSNPTSPRGSHPDLWSVSSPPIRPSSRAHSRGQYNNSSISSIDGMMSPEGRGRFGYEGDSFERSPRHGSDTDSEDDDDGEDPTLGLVLDRNASASMASLESLEREEALERTNQELQRRVMEQDRALQKKITEHEVELEELENLLEETKSELSAKMREEKELRAKETRYIHQISALESDIAERQRALEASKSAYQSLQKQYQEQCTEAEHLRNGLRTRDQQFRESVDKISLHGLEINKWQQQMDQMEQHTQHLEAQLVAAREAQAQLDEQKQENMLLKETIDRMRFDMDELRTKADGSLVPAGSGRDSVHGSIGKSLGVELQRMKGKWPGEDDTDEDESTAVSDDGSGDGDTEGEDVVQTIITRRKKKVTSRAMKRVETIEFEDVRHYSDAYTQHDVSEFATSTMTQTDPEPKRLTSTFSAQTESTPIASSAIQTDPIPVTPPPVKAEMEIQTDALEPEPSRSVTPEESTASSSSTLLPPTPKPAPRDLPPSYAESSKSGEELEQRDMRVAAEAIRKWHKGLDVPLSPIRGGVSEETLEEWAALKGEMGFECLAIDKVLEMSLKTGPRDGARSERSSSSGGSAGPRRKNRFYNIYNTFVYGREDADADRDRDRDRSLAAGLTQAAVVLGVCVLAAGVLSGPYMQPQYHVPGGPSYYDRAAWSEFNRLYPVGEGFVPDGAATVWDFLGRVGGGAARMARGWPA
ncbi:hypothetical protein M0805_009003 [Coniferiporia weirii]|nr:hypothetical protein M0805_009003 [Coniferiporia weirii]